MSEVIHNLNPEQKAAVEHSDGPLLIIAGAGTGKTTVITRRIAHLIQSGAAKPEEIMALTFTEKASREMGERVDKLLQISYTDIQISTFHAFCQKLLEQHGLDIGLPTPFKLLTPAETWRLVKQNFDKFTLDYYCPRSNPTKFIYALIQHFSRCKDELILPEEYLKYAEELQGDSDLAEFTRQKVKKIILPLSSEKEKQSAISNQQSELLEMARIKEVANAYHTYTQIMLENSAVDFGDLLLYAHTLLDQRPNILKQLQTQYKYILVDEFQDTNWAQYQFLKKLTGPEKKITVVGDDDQSIYKWRGASVSNILQFTKDFPKTKTVVLTTNYRSKQKILDSAYNFIQHNNPNRLEPQRGVNKKLKAAVSGDGEVKYIHTATVEEEARFVAREIIELHKQNTPFNEIAILARANSHVDPFMQALRHAGIPYQYQAATGLFKTPVVLDCLSILKILNSHKEHNSTHRVLQLPMFRLSHDDQTSLWWTQRKKGCSLYEALKMGVAGTTRLSEEGISCIQNLLNHINSHIQLAQKKPVGMVLLSFLEQSGYLKHFTSLEEQGDPNAIDTLLRLKAFFDIIEQFGHENPEPFVAQFINYMTDLLDAGEEGSTANLDLIGGDAVQILTVHSAKGLEFQYVFTVNLVEQRFPISARKEKIPVPDALIKETIPEGSHFLEEERRLLYVAITRAKKSITLTSAANYGGMRERRVSRFIKELCVDTTTMEQRSDGATVLTTQEHIARPQDGIQLPLPQTYSFSQLKSYENCPLQYKFAHILKIPTFGKPTFTFGQTIHSTLQKFYECVQEMNQSVQADLFSKPTTQQNTSTVKTPTLDDLLQIYQQSWEDNWYKNEQQKQQYFEDGKKMLKLLYEQQEQNGWVIPELLEKSFSVRVGKHTIRGRIDRVDASPEGGIAIVDYKTGKPKEKLDLGDKEQLFLYQIAAQEIPLFNNLGQVFELNFYYLENGSKQSFIGKPEDLKKYKQKILTTIQKIESYDFVPTPNKWKCQNCDFRDICESRQ